MPDLIDHQTTAADATQASQTTATPAPEQVAAVATPAPATSAAAEPAQAAAQSQSVRDALRAYGLDPAAFPDDHAALSQLAGAYRQSQDLQQLAQYGRHYVQHADAFQAWMRERQAQAQQQQAQSQQWWKAPEYDPSWASKLTRDPATGEIKPVAGADPGVVQKYLAWAEHQRGFLEKFSQDPIKAIQPGIEQLIDQRAQAMIQQHLGGYQEQTLARQVLAQNSEWIHARDAGGRLVMDPGTGRPALSPWGQAYAGYVQQAERMGVRSTMEQHSIAVGMVQRDAALAQLQAAQGGQQAQATGDALKQQFVQQAQHRPQAGAAGAAGANGAPANPAGLGSQRALQDLMLKNLQANGYMPGQAIDLAPR